MAKRCWNIWGIRVCLNFSLTADTTKNVANAGTKELPNEGIDTYIDKYISTGKNNFFITIQVVDANLFKKSGGEINGNKISLPQNITADLDKTSGESKYKIMLAKGTYITGNADEKAKGTPLKEGMVTFVAH